MRSSTERGASFPASARRRSVVAVPVLGQAGGSPQLRMAMAPPKAPAVVAGRSARTAGAASELHPAMNQRWDLASACLAPEFPPCKAGRLSGCLSRHSQQAATDFLGVRHANERQTCSWIAKVSVSSKSSGDVAESEYHAEEYGSLRIAGLRTRA